LGRRYSRISLFAKVVLTLCPDDSIIFNPIMRTALKSPVSDGGVERDRSSVKYFARLQRLASWVLVRDVLQSVRSIDSSISPQGAKVDNSPARSDLRASRKRKPPYGLDLNYLPSDAWPEGFWLMMRGIRTHDEKLRPELRLLREEISEICPGRVLFFQSPILF
jgi:hypothetical protein